MIALTTFRRLALLACAIATIAASPAGSMQPSRIRVATVEGINGPVYYSITEGRFRRIVTLDAREALPECVAQNGI